MYIHKPYISKTHSWAGPIQNHKQKTLKRSRDPQLRATRDLSSWNQLCESTILSQLFCLEDFDIVASKRWIFHIYFYIEKKYFYHPLNDTHTSIAWKKGFAIRYYHFYIYLPKVYIRQKKSTYHPELYIDRSKIYIYLYQNIYIYIEILLNI
jgi:hypothetical protein